MSDDRFFIEHPPQGNVVRLSADEAHHLRRVRRLKAGDEVTLFDGSGTDYLGRIRAMDRGVAVEITAERPAESEPDVHVTLAVAVIKEQRMHRLIDACTQLGMKRLLPVLTERSVVRPRKDKQERWRRVAIEACKQSGRSVVPEIEPVRGLDAVLRTASAHDLAVVASVAPGARPVGEALCRRFRTALCLVGPEGGFTDDEAAAALAAGCLPVRLGRTVLRTETAAAAAVAFLAFADARGRIE